VSQVVINFHGFSARLVAGRIIRRREAKTNFADLSILILESS